MKNNIFKINTQKLFTMILFILIILIALLCMGNLVTGSQNANAQGLSENLTYISDELEVNNLKEIYLDDENGFELQASKNNRIIYSSGEKSAYYLLQILPTAGYFNFSFDIYYADNDVKNREVNVERVSIPIFSDISNFELDSITFDTGTFSSWIKPYKFMVDESEKY